MAIKKKRNKNGKLDKRALKLRDQIFNDLIDILHTYSESALKEIAVEAGVSRSCISNWMYGYTIAPRICNFIKVAHAVEHDIKLVKRASAVLLKAA